MALDLVFYESIIDFLVHKSSDMFILDVITHVLVTSKYDVFRREAASAKSCGTCFYV